MNRYQVSENCCQVCDLITGVLVRSFLMFGLVGLAAGFSNQDVFGQATLALEQEKARSEAHSQAAQDLQDPQQRGEQTNKNQTGSERPASVRPGINDAFLDPDLDPQQYVNRFEVESREVYEARMEVLKACGIETGMRIADIGAGTGLYTRLFSAQTGPTGWVYAVDISPKFVQHINSQAVADQQRNITAVLCQEDSICLPPESIDLAFICDTYHHFEYPQSTLESVFSALKPGGRLIVIDFIRIEGVSRPWVVDHVRAGQEVFAKEILAVGFSQMPPAQIGGFQENYFLMFKKP